MKILNINSYYYSSSVHNQLNESLKDKVKTLDTFVSIPNNYKIREDLGEVNSDIIINKTLNKFDRFFFFKKQNKMEDALLESVKVEEYDVLHAHSLFTNGYLAMEMYKKYNIPYIVAVRSTDINVFFKYFKHLKKTGIKILMNAKKIVFLSTPARENVINKYIPKKYETKIREKCSVIPNGIDSFWFENKVEDAQFIDKTPKILYVGDVSRRKNILSVVKNLKKVKSKPELTVVGKIKDRKLYDKAKSIYEFNYLGVLSKEELLNVYRTNNIFYLPSKNETFGLVYPEAMSQGLPVIYTEKEGFDGNFKDGFIGKSVKYNSEFDGVRAIEYILDNYKQLSTNCLHNFTYFNWKNISNEYIEIYINIVKELRNL